MISYLKGKLTSINPAQVIVDVQGIGYIVFIPHRVLEQLPPLGDSIQLHTAFIVREFSHSLYGFLTSNERDVFEVLLSVSGIGPKLALSLIGHLPLPALQEAVTIHDLPTLCRVPGVGKKTAERLVVELRDKLSHLMQFDSDDFNKTSVRDPKTRAMQDAILALINLGYTHSVAHKAVKQSLKELSDETDLSSIITLALKYT